MCWRETLLLDATRTGIVNYEWQDSSTNSIYNVNSPREYWINVTKNSCSVSDSRVVSYFEFEMNDIKICEISKCLSLESPIQDSCYTYQWTRISASGLGVILSTDAVFCTRLSSLGIGTTKFVLTVIDTCTGCFFRDEFDIDVFAYNDLRCRQYQNPSFCCKKKKRTGNSYFFYGFS